MSMLAALAYWGFHEHDGALGWVLGIGAPLLVAVVWGSFMAPKASRQATDPVRLALEVALFGAGVVALIAAGPQWLGIAFGIAVAVHLAATFPLDQRQPAG